MEYLYGFNVNGIQDYIFKTNKLQEIIGASEIVKSFDDEEFIKKEFELENIEVIMSAAGRFRAKISKNDLEKIALKFPKYALELGLNVSQAWIEIGGVRAQR